LQQQQQQVAAGTSINIHGRVTNARAWQDGKLLAGWEAPGCMGSTAAVPFPIVALTFICGEL
jgi:hypothetical protein